MDQLNLLHKDRFLTMTLENLKRQLHSHYILKAKKRVTVTIETKQNQRRQGHVGMAMSQVWAEST